MSLNGVPEAVAYDRDDSDGGISNVSWIGGSPDMKRSKSKTASSLAANNSKRVSFMPDYAMPSSKKRRAEPDVTVVVGTGDNVDTFHHYSHILCYASDYFDVALHSGMKESQEKRFKFPDRSPEEWRLFASFLEPCGQAKIDHRNVQGLVPWFHHFRVSERLKQCEKVIQLELQDLLQKPSFSWAVQLDVFLERAAFCSLYNFLNTQNWIIKQLNEGFDKDLPSALLQTQTRLCAFCELLRQDDVYRDGLWETIVEWVLHPVDAFNSQYLMADGTQFKSKPQIVDNELFPFLLRMSLKRFQDQQQHYKLVCKMKELVDTGKDLPRRLGKALPKGHAIKKKDGESISALGEKRLKGLMKDSAAWSEHFSETVTIPGGDVSGVLGHSAYV